MAPIIPAQLDAVSPHPPSPQLDPAALQIWGSCVASANAPPALVRRGVQQWLDLGIPAAKLVLGLPWWVHRLDFLPGVNLLCTSNGCPVFAICICRCLRRGFQCSLPAAIPVLQVWLQIRMFQPSFWRRPGDTVRAAAHPLPRRALQRRRRSPALLR